MKPKAIVITVNYNFSRKWPVIGYNLKKIMSL